MKDDENIVSNNIRTKPRNEKRKINHFMGAKRFKDKETKKRREIQCARTLGTDRETQSSKGAENTSSKPEGGNKCLFLIHTFLIQSSN